jgi:hypothetical protein
MNSVFFSIIHNLTPIVSTFGQASVVYSNSDVNYIVNIILILKLLILIICTLFLFFYIKQEFIYEYIPYVIIQKLIVCLILLTIIIYSIYKIFTFTQTETPK